jgi:hypothetical protein
LTTPSGPTMIGPPAAPPATPGTAPEPARTYVPGATGAPIAPGAPGAEASPSGRYYRGPASTDGSGATEPLKIQHIPPVPNGPQLSPAAPSTRPENERTTSRPVLRATYFQLLPSPPPSTPAQLISAPVRTAAHVDDSDWKHVDN